MRDQTLARRYAEALFMAADERGEIDRVNEDVSSAFRVIEDEPRLQQFLESPELLTADKEKVVRSVFGGRAHPLVSDLILLLLHKQRIPYLPQVLELFLRRVEEHRGIVEARVLTPFHLADDLKAKIRGELERKTGLDVKLEERIDRDLIGGVTVIVGDKILDGSIRHELDQMRRHLLEAEMPALELSGGAGAPETNNDS